MANKTDFYRELIDNLYDGVYFVDRATRDNLLEQRG